MILLAMRMEKTMKNNQIIKKSNHPRHNYEHATTVQIIDYQGKKIANILMPHVNFMTAINTINAFISAINPQNVGNKMARQIIDLLQQGYFVDDKNHQETGHQLGSLTIFDRYYAEKIWPHIKLSYADPSSNMMTVAISDKQQELLAKQGEKQCTIDYQTGTIDLSGLASSTSLKDAKSIMECDYSSDILHLDLNELPGFVKELTELVTEYSVSQLKLKTPKKVYWIN